MGLVQWLSQSNEGKMKGKGREGVLIVSKPRREEDKRENKKKLSRHFENKRVTITNES